MNCEDGKAEECTWNDAMQRFKHVEDWRLPTVDELKNLLHCSKGRDKNDNCNKGSEAPPSIGRLFPIIMPTQSGPIRPMRATRSSISISDIPPFSTAKTATQC